MAGWLVDSNIIIDALNRHGPALAALKQAGPIVISRISWIEIMAGAPVEQREATAAVLRGFDVIELDAAIGERAAWIRRATRLKLPDAIVMATAEATGRALVTRDRRLAAKMPASLVPY